ncbi:MAG: alpha-ketoglutarate-dependent dioxygenase AlkB [Planctomycetes bacterium]|nr:alpha-ketoglutarate-dependent dioxygenase AlkB [Planctomycetota bacterium]
MFRLTVHELGDGHHVLVGALPPRLLPNAEGFEELWNLHPPRPHVVRMLGRRIPTPRWQQAYGRDYRYTGSTNVALPIPAGLRQFLESARKAVDRRLNGVLLNWYDGAKRHHIGQHRDSRTGLVPGAPIVTISLGERRTFRMRQRGGAGRLDLEVADGTVIVMPYEVNLAWTHEVPHRAGDVGRRISITLRSFA